jgi:F420-0:gamma-glutamyl ligase
MSSFSIHALPGIGEISAGDDLPHIIASALGTHAVELARQDVLVIAQKVVSKAKTALSICIRCIPLRAPESWPS